MGRSNHLLSRKAQFFCSERESRTKVIHNQRREMEERSGSVSPRYHKEFRRPLLEILEDLRQPIPKRFIKTKTIKGKMSVAKYERLAGVEAISSGRRRRSQISNLMPKSTPKTDSIPCKTSAETHSRSSFSS